MHTHTHTLSLSLSLSLLLIHSLTHILSYYLHLCIDETLSLTFYSRFTTATEEAVGISVLSQHGGTVIHSPKYLSHFITTYVHLPTYICIHIHIHIYIYIYIHIHIRALVYIHSHSSLFTLLYHVSYQPQPLLSIYIYIYHLITHMFISLTRSYTYIHTYTHYICMHSSVYLCISVSTHLFAHPPLLEYPYLQIQIGAWCLLLHSRLHALPTTEECCIYIYT